MNFFLFLIALLIVIPTEGLAATDCDQLTGCQAKICHLERQIEMAKQYNNDAKLSGLNTALRNVRDHCTDDSLKEKIQEDISKTQEDLQEYRKDLEEAKAYNKSDKISKYQRKISEKEHDLSLFQKKLEELQ